MFTQKIQTALSTAAVAIALTVGGTGVAAAQSNSVGETSVDSGVVAGSNYGMTPNVVGTIAPYHQASRFAQSQNVGETSIDSGLGAGSNHGMTPNAIAPSVNPTGPSEFAQSQPVGETSIDSGTLNGSNHGMSPNVNTQSNASQGSYASSNGGR